MALEIMPARIDVRRATEILGLSKRVIQQMAQHHELPSAARENGVWTFEEAALRQFLSDLERQQRESRPKIGPSVYFAFAGGMIKIGFSTYWPSRLRGLQFAMPVTIDRFVTIDGSAALEGELHRRFAHLRRHGEWFDAKSDLVEFINSVDPARSIQ